MKMKRLFLLPLLTLFFLSGCQDGGSGGDDSPDWLKEAKNKDYGRIGYVYYEPFETDTSYINSWVSVQMNMINPSKSRVGVAFGIATNKSAADGKLEAGEWSLTVNNYLNNTTFTETVTINKNEKLLLTFSKDGSYTKSREYAPTDYSYKGTAWYEGNENGF